VTILRASTRDSLTAEEAARLTFHYERLRAVAAGVLETAGATFLLLIAVSYFKAGRTEKALLAAGFNPGLLLTPLVVYVVSRARLRATAAAACLAALGALGFLVAATVPSLPVYMWGCLAGLLCGTSFVPLLTQMYQENYPGDRRGRLFTNAVMVRIATAALFSFWAGWLLTPYLGLFRWLLLLYALALAGSAYCLWRCPSRPLARSSAGLFSGLRHVRDDYVFRQTLISWSLMGFANLMMYQLRVEYMANSEYGVPFKTAVIAAVTGYIPNLARLVLSPVWGRLFDRMNFFTLRITLNVGLALGVIAFFAGRDLTGMVTGALIYGVTNAGGEVAWGLWVTKLAPPERVAEYMAVHTFLTGVRGVGAPLLGYYLLKHCSFHTLSLVCTGLIAVATLMLIPELRAGRQAKPGPGLVREVAD